MNIENLNKVKTCMNASQVNNKDLPLNKANGDKPPKPPQPSRANGDKPPTPPKPPKHMN